MHLKINYSLSKTRNERKIPIIDTAFSMHTFIYRKRNAFNAILLRSNEFHIQFKYQINCFKHFSTRPHIFAIHRLDNSYEHTYIHKKYHSEHFLLIRDCGKHKKKTHTLTYKQIYLYKESLSRFEWKTKITFAHRVLPPQWCWHLTRPQTITKKNERKIAIYVLARKCSVYSAFTYWFCGVFAMRANYILHIAFASYRICFHTN